MISTPVRSSHLIERLRWAVADAWTVALRDLMPAYGNMRFPVEASVNPYASDEAKAVAWDFWHYTYSCPSNVLNDMALNNGFVPAYNDVLDDPAVTEDPIMASLAPTMEYSIISDVPDPVRIEQNQLLEQVILDAHSTRCVGSPATYRPRTDTLGYVERRPRSGPSGGITASEDSARSPLPLPAWEIAYAIAVAYPDAPP